MLDDLWWTFVILPCNACNMVLGGPGTLHRWNSIWSELKCRQLVVLSIVTSRLIDIEGAKKE